jgi:hypothetical protein
LRKLTYSLLAILLTTIVLGTIGYASTSSALTIIVSQLIHVASWHQGITGNVTILYWSTICTSPIKGLDLKVTSANGRILLVHLSWSVKVENPCTHFSSFRVDLDPGTYSVTLSQTFGCHKPESGSSGGFYCNLPFSVNVESGVYSPVVIGFGGGI